MGFMNGFPPGHFNNTTSVNNQWQQMNRSPNSMGSNGSPSGIMHSNMPAAPSPLLNSVNSSSIMSNQGMGGGGTPQQPGSVKTPLSVQQQTSSNPGLMTLKNPFEEDLESRPASRQQMPPPTNTNQRLYFDIIKEVRSPMYCNGNDPMFRLRLPMAYNTIGAEMNLPYPNTNINRSPSIPIQKSMPLQMPPQMPPQMQMPVTSSAPIPQQPATTTRKRQTKKQKEQQEQMQASQMNGGGPMPNFPHGMLPMAIDPSRPCSSHDLNTRSSPGTIQMNMKGLFNFEAIIHYYVCLVLGRSPSTDVFPHLPGRNIPMKLMPNEKCATENYNCFHCNSLITVSFRLF